MEFIKTSTVYWVSVCTETLRTALVYATQEYFLYIMRGHHVFKHKRFEATTELNYL